MEQPVIQRNGVVQHGTDAGLFVEFYMEALEDEEQSKALGRPIYRNVEFIKIIPLGDKHTVVARPVRLVPEGNQPADPDRWPVKYQQFKNQQVQIEDGTPVEEWPPLNKAQALTLKGLNIHTVEALAQVSDHNLSNIGMGARELREKAKAFIEESENGSGLMRLQAENDDLRLQIQAMKAQMEGFAKMMEENKKHPELAAPALIIDNNYGAGPNPIMPEPINFTTTPTYGKRGRPPKQKEQINA